MLFKSPQNPPRTVHGLPSIFQHNMDDPDLRKRLGDPKTDITDYFNYGLNERTWRLLSEKVVQLASKTEKFISEEGTSKVLPDKLPLEFGGFGTPHYDVLKELPFFMMLKRHRERFFAKFQERNYYYHPHGGLQEQLRYCLAPEQSQSYADVKNCYNQVAPGLLELKQPLPTANHLYRRPLGTGPQYVRPQIRGPLGNRPYDQNMAGGYASSAHENNVAAGAVAQSVVSNSEVSSIHSGYRPSNTAPGCTNLGYSRSVNEASSTPGHSAQFTKLKLNDNSGSKTSSLQPQSSEKRSRSRSRSSDRSRDRKDRSKKKRDRDSRDRSSRDRRSPSRDRRPDRADKPSKRSRSRSRSADKHDKHGSRTTKKHSERDERHKKSDRSSRDRKDKKEKEGKDRHKTSGKESSRRRDRSSHSRSSRGSPERGKKSGGHRSPKKSEKTSIHDRIQVRK